MTAVVLQTFGEALGSLFGGLALIAIAIMVLGIGFIIFAIVLIIFLVKRHKDKKNGIIIFSFDHLTLLLIEVNSSSANLACLFWNKASEL